MKDSQSAHAMFNSIQFKSFTATVVIRLQTKVNLLKDFPAASKTYSCSWSVQFNSFLCRVMTNMGYRINVDEVECTLYDAKLDKE